MMHLSPWTLHTGDFVQIIDIRLTLDGNFRVWIEFPGQVWAWGDRDTFVLVSVRHRWELVTTATDWAVTRRADGQPAAVAHSTVMGPTTTPPDPAPAAGTVADGESPLHNVWADTRSRSPTGDDDLGP